jgi:hypothetical protein
MTQASFQVATYMYYLWSSRSIGSGYPRTNLILQGQGKTCSVWFKDDPQDQLPAATLSGSNMVFWYYYSQLDHLIDMLRNEGPVSVFFNDDIGPSSRISTSAEPVGDGEIP